MDDVEARVVLGVAPDAGWDEVRRAFRRLVRATHPDLAAELADAGARTARLTEAYAVLRRHRDLPPAPAPQPPPAPPLAVAVLGSDTVRLVAPRGEAFMALLEAAHRFGEVTYLDRQGGLLEVVVEFDPAPTCSVVLTLQGRAMGTDVFVSIESLSAAPPPPTAAVTALVAAHLQALHA